MKLTLIYLFYQKSLLWWIDNDDEEEDDGIGNQKSKLTKKCVIKRKLKFEDYFNCLGANRFENKINHLQNNKIDVDSLKEFLKTIDQYYQSINQSKQRFRSKKYNLFPEEVYKVAMSANTFYIQDFSIQDFIETYAYGTSENTIGKKRKNWI